MSKLVSKPPDAAPTSALGAVRKRMHQQRLAKRERILSQVRFRLSREGFHFVLILLFILVGAVLRNISLLIVLAGVMFALLLIQWRVGRRSLRGLKFYRELPNSTACGQPVDVAVTIMNTRSFLGSWLLTVEETVTQLGPEHEVSSKKGMAIVDDVAPRRARRETYQLEFRRRGVYEIGPTNVWTRYPLNLGHASRVYLARSHITVHPRLGVLTNRCPELLRVERQGLARSLSRAGVNEGEFFGLRPWHNGDSRRWIHWRTTARLGELSVRQFEQQQRMQLSVALDLHLPSGAAGKSTAHREAVEAAISFVATLAVNFVGRGRHKMSVVIAGRELVVSPNVQSRILVTELLDSLAIATSAEESQLARGLESLQATLVRSPQLLIVSTRPNCLTSVLGTMTDSLGKRVLGRSTSQWVNVTAGELEPYFQWSEHKSSASG